MANINYDKINTFIDAYCIALNLDVKFNTYLKEMIVNLISKYSSIKPMISIDEDYDDLYLIKPNNGFYSIEDFFLNRLFRNVLQFEYDFSSANSFLAAKGRYSPSEHLLEINENLISDSVETTKYAIETLGFTCDKTLLHETIYKKVVMHEFEHGLKVVYNKGRVEDKYLKTMRKISDLLMYSKYSNIITSSKELKKINKSRKEPEKWIYSGMQKHRNDIKYIGYLDELCNENESVDIAGCQVQLHYGSPDLYYEVKNFESSSWFFYSTINIFKALVGEENVFDGAYLNPDKLIDNFNSRFNYIFQKVSSCEKSALDIFVTLLDNVKENSMVDKLKIEELLMLCFYEEFDKRNQFDSERARNDWNYINENAIKVSAEMCEKLKDKKDLSYFRTWLAIQQGVDSKLNMRGYK